MKTTLILILATLSSSHAAISLVSSDNTSNGNTTPYGSAFFSSIAVQAGDVLVVAHANNKRDNGSNSISASATGETFTTISGGNSGGQSGAWLFYSTIANNGTVDITLNTSNTSTSASKSNAYYLLRPGAGESIQLASSDTLANSTTTTLGITLDSSGIGGFGVLAAAVATDTITGTPTGWTEDRNAVDKRIIWSNANTTDLSPSVTITDTEFDVAVGAAFVAIPEPSTLILSALSVLASFTRRRR